LEGGRFEGEREGYDERIDELTEKNRKLRETIALIKKKIEEDGAE
jgi:hypothetical protein